MAFGGMKEKYNFWIMQTTAESKIKQIKMKTAERKGKAERS